MNDRKYLKKDIKIGSLRNFSVNNGGADLTNYGYVFMVKNKEWYVNPLNIWEEYPIYERLPYTNYTQNGDSYGSKLRIIQGDICDGPCIILYNNTLDYIADEEEISLSELRNIVLNSNDFFKDYEDVVIESQYNPLKEIITLKKHKEKIKKLNKFLNKEEFQLKKRNKVKEWKL